MNGDAMKNIIIVLAAAGLALAGCGSDDVVAGADMATTSCSRAITETATSNQYKMTDTIITETAVEKRDDGLYVTATITGKNMLGEDTRRSGSCLAIHDSTTDTVTSETIGLVDYGDQVPERKMTDTEKRNRACGVIKQLTPGMVELSWSTKVLADPDSTQAEKTQALRNSLDARSATEPYQCSGKVFERFLGEQVD